jgi:hypothetical protein
MVEATARTTIWVYDDRVRITKVYPVRTQETTLRYSQIAELVNVRPGLIFAELRIETTGGAVLLVKGLPNARAQQAYEVINERL